MNFREINSQVIRPGQRRPYVKGTRGQIGQRISFVALLIREGKGKFEIHRLVREKFNVEWRQCDRYIDMARTRNKGEIHDESQIQTKQ